MFDFISPWGIISPHIPNGGRISTFPVDGQLTDYPDGGRIIDEGR